MPKTSYSSAVVLAAFIAAAAGAACKDKSSSPATPSCTASAGTPAASTFDAAAATSTVAVTAGTGCAWTATSNASFITISQGASGTGSGIVTFALSANSGADRTGTITVAGTTITITQRGAAATTPASLGAPTATSPVGGQTVDSARPTLVVSNATATGSVGTVTYRFEISDLPSFPSDAARTFSRDGVPQGTGSTSAVIDRDLGPSVLWYWHARATNGTVTGAYSPTETFRTPGTCSYTLSATNVTVAGGAGSATVSVATGSGCAWTAASNASFITITSGASGTGNGDVTFAVTSSGGTARTGTLTIAGQTVTVSQQGASVVAGFNLIDPQVGPGTTTTCSIRSLTGTPTACTLQSTSFPLGTVGIASYDWLVEYNYPSQKTLRQSGLGMSFTFTDLCGQGGANDSGLEVELNVRLTVTDTNGNSITVMSNAGSQPRLVLRAYICGI